MAKVQKGTFRAPKCKKTAKIQGFRPFSPSMTFQILYFLQNGTIEILFLDDSRPSWQYKERYQGPFLWEIFPVRPAARQLTVQAITGRQRKDFSKGPTSMELSS